jgi:hypothetical protein
MKNYIAHIKTKPPHERRQHAMQLSAGIIAVVFVVWISTIGLRFASTPAQTADSNNTNQLANILNGTSVQNATLIVASSSQGY